MPERATYTVWLDDVENPGSTTDTDLNITSYVTNINFTYGMNEPYQSFAPPARAYITCANESGDFNPDNSGAKFYSKVKRGQIVRLYMDTGTGDTKIFTGKIVERDYSAEDYVTLIVEDQMLRLLNHNIEPPLLTDTGIDAVIRSVFELEAALWPYDHVFFRIGYSELGDFDPATNINQNNVLLGPGTEGVDGAYRNLSTETSKTTLAYAGDITRTITGAQTYLREIVAAEGGGRFFWDAPNEVFRFQNRWVNSVNYSVDATLTGTQIESGLFSMDDNLVNECEVAYRPRAVSGSSTVLYSAPSVTPLKTSTTLELTVTYQDPANPSSTCGGLDPECIPGTDLIINTAEDGSGDNVTAQQIVTIEFNATSASINITNTTSATLYVTKLQVRGRPISLLASETAKHKDIESIRTYDLYPMTISIPALDDGDIAESIARLKVLFQGEPKRRFRRVTFWANHSATLMGYAKDLRIGDGIQLTYDNHDMKYVIIGQEHQIAPGGSRGHRVSYWLQSAETGNFFTLNLSELNSRDVLAF